MAITYPLGNRFTAQGQVKIGHVVIITLSSKTIMAICHSHVVAWIPPI